ncbi:MAG TPA: deoxyribodipyrimidine photo-lyase [Flavobacteriaceae bacterium]|nr:deoxyribodipyrimidine photo-lyase [Flavobacteriaceae bacterium]
MTKNINIFWFRRDLRLNDNTGLYHALQNDIPVLLVFIFDTEIINTLPKNDARVSFIFHSLQEMKKTLQHNFGSSIAIYKGKPLEVFKKITEEYSVKSVFTNRDYEPYATKRDAEMERFLKSRSITFKTYKDHVIFEKSEIVKANGEPYKVFSPYMKAWKETFSKTLLKNYDTSSLLSQTLQRKNLPDLTLKDLGFVVSTQEIEPYTVTPKLIQDYESTRNFPAANGTSRLGPHLRFGTISIRDVVKKATAQKNEVFWQELIWREFFIQILWHYPQTVNQSFKPQYDRILWRNNETEFNAWCKGNTGYPLVDAGMRELNHTGYMHNRVRMIVGSFLCKHLLIDWRWGEAYFAEKLHDFELASNVGNWQWVAGCGVDAAPYFRIFNPTSQIAKFDKNHNYIKKWVPEYQELTYAKPIVDHKEARERCLATYKNALS